MLKYYYLITVRANNSGMGVKGLSIPYMLSSAIHQRVGKGLKDSTAFLFLHIYQVFFNIMMTGFALKLSTLIPHTCIEFTFWQSYVNLQLRTNVLN